MDQGWIGVGQFGDSTRKDLDHPDGFKIFESMLKLSPNFTHMKGGFLSISVNESKISMTHHDVLGNAVYEWHKPL